MPNCFIARDIALPPPWTMTGFTPMILSSTISAMTSARSSASSMADPPYFMTTVFPVTFLIQGIASVSTSPVMLETPLGLVSVLYFMIGTLR